MGVVGSAITTLDKKARRPHYLAISNASCFGLRVEGGAVGSGLGLGWTGEGGRGFSYTTLDRLRLSLRLGGGR